MKKKSGTIIFPILVVMMSLVVGLSNNEKIKVSGVFIYVGYKANSELVNDLDIINADGRIMVDNNCETKIKGLYAIGDVNDKGIYQLITASNDGVIAIANITKKI